MNKPNEISYRQDNFSHFIGLSIDDKGLPLRWFTTNRWVTAGHWWSAEDSFQLLPTFTVKANGRLAPVANWINAMVKLFQPQIAQLLLRRDAAMARYIAISGREFSFENRRLDVVTECSASVPARIKQLVF